MFRFGRRSRSKLNTCDPDLVRVAEYALRTSRIDFSITEGFRSPERQSSLYAKGRRFHGGKWYIVDRSRIVTYKDGTKNKSKHNFLPSRAFDIAAYIPGRPDLAFDKDLLLYLAGVITAAAEKLYRDGEISKPIIWGADWNKNGRIDDENFVDMPHYQTI